MDIEFVVRWLARGGRSVTDGARGEARRVLDVLVERGDLSRAEADQIEAGVADAAEQHKRWVEERVIAPIASRLRAASGAGSAGVESRLAAIEARLARIEAALAARGSGRAPEDA